LEVFIDENNSGLNLKEIALKHECSYEQLKAIFVEGGQDVILHSYNKSKGELEVKKFIEDLGFTVKSVKKKFEEDRFEIDCFIEDKNFGIEYCGEYWHSQNIGIKQDYHQRKTIWAQKQGIKLMTIFEHEWYTKRQLLENMIKIRLGLVETKIYARKTMIAIIPKSVACHFHNRNHIQGGLKTSTVDIGLYYNGELISVDSMDINHLRNTLKMIIRNSNKHKVQQKEAKQFKLNGDAANMFNDDMQNYENECDATECDLY
jgi:hypothetical protein